MDYIWIVEINTFCAVVMGIVLYSLYKNYDRQTKQRCYMKAVLFAVLSFISEMLWALIESRILLFPRYANFFVNAVYDVAACCTGYFWLCYVETSLESKFIQSRLLKTIALLPVVIIIAAVIGSFFNGFLFYIDENNKYVRGKYLYLHVVMCQLYTLITSAHAFYKSIETKSYMKKIEYRILSMFLIFPLVLGLIQIFVPHIPSISVGITLSFLFVYIDLQNLLISVDTLTSLNNRNQLMRYLSMRIKNENERNKLYVFMLDVNKFKKINDTFGHVEGDAALIYCANALRDANRDSNNFIGRYGGDEYIIVSELDSEAEAELLCNKISLSLEKITKEANLPYSLTFSFGYALYNEKMKTIQSFIAAADKKLYEYKKNLNAD